MATNDRVVKAAENAVAHYWDEVGTDGQRSVPWNDTWFKYSFDLDSAPGGPCEGISWSEFRPAAIAALPRRAQGEAFWRTATRDVTVVASNPRPSFRSRMPGRSPDELDVDVTVTIDDHPHLGTVRLARQPNGQLAADSDPTEH
jgi:hypothetical protein